MLESFLYLAAHLKQIMKYRQIFILASLPILVLNLYGVVMEIAWIVDFSEFLVYLPLFIGFYRKLNFTNINIIAFLSFSICAVLLRFFGEEKMLYLTSMIFSMLAYIFLYREALNYTKRETANKFMLSFFIILICANGYFLSSHLQEIELHIPSILEFGFYSIYYINLLVLGVVGLIYYLNSYSRKSVYFITLVMAIVFADVFRDMAAFYLRDTSVSLIESVLRYSAVILAFCFFATREKKLRLINLV